MKANVFFKAMCVAVVMIASTMMVSAGNPYYTNDVKDGEKVVSRFVYKMDNGLQYHLKSDFTYDNENRLATKETFTWNNKSQEWVPQKRVHYTYSHTEITITGDTWNKKDKVYAEGIQQSIYDINIAGLETAHLTAK